MRRHTRHRPLFIAASVYAVLMAMYQVVLTPRMPQEYRRYDVRVDSTVRVPGLPRTFNCVRDPETASVLVIGDSRVQRGLYVDELERAGLPTTALVWTRGAKTSDLLQVIRRYPSRRLVVSLSTIGVYFERSALIAEPDLSFTASVDDWTRTRARAFQRGQVRMIETGAWAQHWFHERQPHNNDNRYKRFVRRATRTQRDANLVELESDLRDLIAAGWDIVCMRMPIAPDLFDVEDAGFPRERFSGMCERLGVPFLDHVREPYETFDGSHLTKHAAFGYSEYLGAEVLRVSEWRADRD